MATPEVAPTEAQQHTMQQAAKDDILHFQELLEAIKVTFPSADYAGTWLDLHGLLTLLRLSHMNGEDKQTGWAKGRPQGLCRFFAGVEHEVEKVKKHFRVTAVGLIKAWRSDHAPGENNLSHSIPPQDVLSQPKLGQSARYCWQYAVVNYASVVRLQEVHNTLFEHHPYKVDFEPFLAGKHAMIDHLLLEEIYAVSVLCGPREGEGLTASAKGTHATCDFFSNGLFNCSFTLGQSAFRRLMPGSVDVTCPACEKATLANPRGMGACGHIVCEPCLRSAVKKHSHSVGGMMVHALAPGHDHVPCPLCKLKSIPGEIMEMPALGLWLASQN